MPLVISSEIVKVWNMWGIRFFWITMHSPFDIYYTHKKWQKNDNALLNEISVKNHINIFKNCMYKDISCVLLENLFAIKGN